MTYAADMSGWDRGPRDGGPGPGRGRGVERAIEEVLDQVFDRTGGRGAGRGCGPKGEAGRGTAHERGREHGRGRGRWADETDPADGREGREGHRGHGGRGGPGGHGGRGFDGPFGPNGVFGPNGPFGPGGPFGPEGPFGPGGPFGGGPGRGRRGGRARRGEVRLAALHLIAEGPMNGYQIIQALDERTGGAWKPSPGAIYPALAQLEDEGLVEPVEEGGRKAFRLTDAGRAEVEAATGPKPWEFEEQDTADDGRRAPVKELWGAFAQVATANQAVTQTGDPELVRAATELLVETRRSLYRLLADGAPAERGASDEPRGGGDGPQDRVDPRADERDDPDGDATR